MRFEQLIQFLVPLTFLAIWAITSLFNRDAPPLPPRRGQPNAPDGPRAAESARRESFGSLEESTTRSLTHNDADRSQTRPRTAPGRPIDEGIVIVESTDRRARREARGRGASRGAAGRPAAQEPSRSGLNVDMHRPSAVHLREMQGLVPLTSTSRPLTKAGHEANVLPPEESAVPSRPVDLSEAGGAPLRTLASNPQRLRDAFIAAEVLFRPPVAHRGRAPRRPGQTPLA